MSGLLVAAITLGLIVLSAFFVIIEFALLSARQHRLENDAAQSASARAALRGMNELTLMLAAAQLGITACTFALGAITKPAVDQWLGPVLTGWGVPAGIADGTAFALSLLFVTFLHLVIGEMAPKSWAIAHPETSAKLIGLPARGFMWVLRPLLIWVNTIANRLVQASGVTPVERAAVGGQDIDTIRQLVEQSTSKGALESEFGHHLTDVIGLNDLTLADLVRQDVPPTSVPEHATASDVWQASAASGHMRILIAQQGAPPALIHVRDTLLADPSDPVESLARPAFTLSAATPVYEALASSRRASEQLIVVTEEGGPTPFVGVVSVKDIINRVLPTARRV
ncbi:CNNM domain-containing protein [Zhihengliuella flava]|uniref:CBS domain containing-hemolysin-like protein n=1 Tax=Zhihengliuella flava TaxID=1285193 RepID=A0A931D7X9_9MICC|nr:CNNM domain-containing protein [Zhihengliuella flava]MBG6084054.1 CBS domain containing-hemolysin-like protein [Zhihengliuella flava]